jgi:hypothetical protein
MANNAWYYPTQATATATLTFDTKGHLIDGSDFRLIPNQQLSQAKGGTRFAESFGANKQAYDFTFLVPESSGSVSDRADVVAFFDAVLGGAYSFVWVDESSVSRTVRCVSDTIRFQRQGIYWRVTVTLEVQA